MIDLKNLELIKTRLLEDRNLVLKGEAGGLFEGDRVSEENEKAAVESQQTLDVRLRNRELLYLKKIDSALNRIQNQEYGLCESCANEISLKRLIARPTAELCIHCKEDQERMESQRVKVHKSLGTSLNDFASPN